MADAKQRRQRSSNLLDMMNAMVIPRTYYLEYVSVTRLKSCPDLCRTNITELLESLIVGGGHLLKQTSAFAAVPAI